MNKRSTFSFKQKTKIYIYIYKNLSSFMDDITGREGELVLADSKSPSTMVLKDFEMIWLAGKTKVVLN